MSEWRYKANILGAIKEADSEILKAKDGILALQVHLSQMWSRKKMLEKLLSVGNEDDQAEFIHGLGRVLRED